MPTPKPKIGDEKNYADYIFNINRLVLGRELTTDEKEQIVKTEANKLIAWLYDPIPDDTIGWIANSHARLFDSEAINWGDLSVVDVIMTMGKFSIIVEEAGPSCPLFCAWLADSMRAWGFPIKEVRTEW